jgi:rod shape determining protein RodA
MYVFLLKLRKIPVFVLLSIVIANIIGLTTLYSASNMEIYPLLYKQLMSFLLFILIAIFLSTVELKTIYRFSYHIYFFLIIILLLIELLGHKAMGATRWINLLGFKIQPSEFMKIGVILFLAKYYHNVNTLNLKSFHSIIIPIIFTIIPALIVIKQPDLGSGLIIILSSATIIFASGVQLRHILYLVLPVLFLIPIGWKFLHGYQKKRLLVFLNPESDPLGSGYNIIQSKIAIGSGGLFGKGIGYGTQSKLDFLPEHETDFIFSCFAEETGLVGSIVLIFIYFIIIVQSLSIASNARSVYGKILTLGIVSIFFLHILINISMVSGIFPVTGKPLPFMSYGRNILGSMLIGFGLIMNVCVHQKENFVKS